MYKKGIKHTLVKYDETFWKEEMEVHLRTFYMDCLVPEIVDSCFNRHMAIQEPTYGIEVQRKYNEKKEKTKENASLSQKRRKRKTKE